MFQPSKLGIEDTIFDWSERVKEILVRAGAESQYGQL